MKTSKRAREARKKLAKDPAGKKGQEIWDGPGTTYVPHQNYVYKINRLQISKSYRKIDTKDNKPYIAKHSYNSSKQYKLPITNNLIK